MENVFLLLGGNQANTLSLFKQALQRLHLQGVGVVKTSALYQTAAWGNTHQSPYYNVCVESNTSFSPTQLLECILLIEKELGRVRSTDQYAERGIDIDILFYNDFVLESPALTLPHPRLHLRKFTLIPLTEIAPNFVHPKFDLAISDLLNQCTDTLAVEAIGNFIWNS